LFSSKNHITFPHGVSAYCLIEAALELACYDKLEDGSLPAKSQAQGRGAFGQSLRECESELRSTLEDWILVGLRLGHKLPVLAGIDLNKVQNGGWRPLKRRDFIRKLRALGFDGPYSGTATSSWS